MIILHNEVPEGKMGEYIRSGKIRWGGNVSAKIYGTLECYQGKRLNKNNRIFFSTEAEAIGAGYRPCGSCCKAKYNIWKENNGK